MFLSSQLTIKQYKGGRIHMLEIKNISKKIEDKSIVNALHIKIEAGQNVALIGPNGAGKTTTMKMIMGLITSDSDDITMAGLSKQKNNRAYLQLLGYVPDEPFVYEKLKGSEFFSFTADLWDKNLYNNNRHTFEETIQELEMGDYLEEPIHTYSLGMKKKLSLLIALIHQPRILIMDEPLNGLDPMTVYTIKNYINAYIEKGNSVLMSTHMMDVAESFCSHIAVIKKGNLLIHQSIKDMQKNQSKTLEEYFIQLVREEEL